MAANKTKTMKVSPYPDIVGWWKSVNSIFVLSKAKLAKLKMRLFLHQLKEEQCGTYSSRFEDKVATLKDMGAVLDDHKLGVTLFKRLTPHNSRILTMFMKFDSITANLSRVVGLCKCLDESEVKEYSEGEENPLKANLVVDKPTTPFKTSYKGSALQSEPRQDLPKNTTFANNNHLYGREL